MWFQCPHLPPPRNRCQSAPSSFLFLGTPLYHLGTTFALGISLFLNSRIPLSSSSSISFRFCSSNSSRCLTFSLTISSNSLRCLIRWSVAQWKGWAVTGCTFSFRCACDAPIWACNILKLGRTTELTLLPVLLLFDNDVIDLVIRWPSQPLRACIRRSEAKWNSTGRVELNMSD